MSIDNKIIDDENEDEGEDEPEQEEKIIFIPKLPGCEELDHTNYETYKLSNSIALQIDNTIFITNIIGLSKYVKYFSVSTFYDKDNVDKYNEQILKDVIDNVIDLNYIISSLNDDKNIKKYYTAHGLRYILNYIHHLPLIDNYKPFNDEQLKNEYIYDITITHNKYLKYVYEVEFIKKIIPKINYKIECDQNIKIVSLKTVIIKHNNLIKVFNRESLKTFYEVYYLSDFFGCVILCDLLKYVSAVIHNKFIHISYKITDSCEYGEYNVKYKNKYINDLFGTVEDAILSKNAKKLLEELNSGKYKTFHEFGNFLIKNNDNDDENSYFKMLTSINDKGNGSYNERILNHIYNTYDRKNKTDFQMKFYIKNKYIFTESYSINFNKLKDNEKNIILDDLDPITKKEEEEDIFDGLGPITKKEEEDILDSL